MSGFLPGATSLPTIRTPRLTLRAITPADVPALHAIFADADVCRYWSRPPLADLAAATALQEEIAQHFAARTLFQWGLVEDGGDDALVGTCTIAWLSAEHRNASVGFALRRDRWGRGYIAEALPAMVRFAFETLELHRLEADADPRNAASIRALERVGFVREGYQRERYWMSGEWQDAVLFGLLRREWEAAGAGGG